MLGSVSHLILMASNALYVFLWGKNVIVIALHLIVTSNIPTNGQIVYLLVVKQKNCFCNVKLVALDLNFSIVLNEQMNLWLGNRKRILVLNREDMISTADRNAWAAYFTKQGTKVIFSNGQLGAVYKKSILFLSCLHNL